MVEISFCGHIWPCLKTPTLKIKSGYFEVDNDLIFLPSNEPSEQHKLTLEAVRKLTYILLLSAPNKHRQPSKQSTLPLCRSIVIN